MSETTLTPFIFGINESTRDSALRDLHDVYGAVGQNTGNLAFTHAASKLLGGGLPSISWYDPAERINTFGEVGIMPCANQVGPHADYGSVAENFEGLTCKLVAIGLGAQSDLRYSDIPVVPEGTLRWLKQIVERAPTSAPNITVRGEFSRRVLEHYGFGDSAVVMGCPSVFLNPDPNLGKKIHQRAIDGQFQRVAVAGGHQGWKHLAKIERSLAHIMAVTGGTYITQSPEQMVAIGRGEVSELAEEDLAAIRDFVMPELTINEFAAWANRYARAFFDPTAWMEYLRRYDLVIGLRIHGVMLALQAGIPGLCIVHDSRTRELCETLKVPFILASDVVNGISRSQLDEIFDFDPAEFDQNREILGKKMGIFLTQNRLGINPAYSELLKI